VSSSRTLVARLLLSLSVLAPAIGFAQAPTTLLNVSYDPTRELYQEFNAAFARHWQASAREKASLAHFADGATFDQIYQPGRKGL
jgi:sulfate transport system substrate-binding protein